MKKVSGANICVWWTIFVFSSSYADFNQLYGKDGAPYVFSSKNVCEQSKKALEEELIFWQIYFRCVPIPEDKED